MNEKYMYKKLKERKSGRPTVGEHTSWAAGGGSVGGLNSGMIS
jgi:hypothetical protein